MDDIKTFNSTVPGESHKASKKPCQDSSKCFEDKDSDLYIVTVSDGHGGVSYFRSEKGSDFLTTIVIESVKQFVNETELDFTDTPFSQVPARSTELAQWNEAKGKGIGIKQRVVNNYDKAFHHLFSSIVSQWYEIIEKDWRNNPPTEEEYDFFKVPKSTINKFQNGDNIEEVYGCTLITFVRTKTYWFAFQLGDGKCISFDEFANWSEPILWDKACYSNVTTSICESNPIDSFRYSYGNKCSFPVAVFIASDGLDDSYGSDLEDLSLLYNVFSRSFVNDGFETTVKEITEYLPILSKQGSRDDMSLAGIIDLKKTKKIYPLLIEKEIEKETEKLSFLDAKISKKEANVKEIKTRLNQEESINKRLNNDIKKTETKLQKITKEIISLNSDKEKNENKLITFGKNNTNVKAKIADEKAKLASEQAFLDKTLKEKELIHKKICELRVQLDEKI